MKKIIFCTMMDDNFFFGFSGFFKSLLNHNPNFDYSFYIIDNGISEEIWKKMLEIYPNIQKISFDKNDYRFSKNVTKPELISTFYKLEMFKIGLDNSSIDRVIFIDMDMLIQGSIEDLIEYNLNENSIGACKQWIQRKDKTVNEINSGLIIIDTKKISQNDYKILLRMTFEKHFLPDQEIINNFFVKTNRCEFLPKIYNVEKRMLYSRNFRDIYKEAVCLHFVGVKPWQEKAYLEKAYYSVYSKWWDIMIEELKENSIIEVDPKEIREDIPNDLLKKPFKFVNKQSSLFFDGKYKTIFLSSKEKYTSSFIIQAFMNHLEVGGIMCGDGFSMKTTEYPGALIKLLKRKFDYRDGEFWRFIKKESDLNIFFPSSGIPEDPISNFEYNEFLRDKSIIFVGPAPILKGKKLGEFIDSFDLVVRTNNMMNTLLFNPELKEDYGTKNNILYVNVTYERDAYKEWNPEEWKEMGIEIVCKAMNKRPKIHFPFKWRHTSRKPKLPSPTLFLGTTLIHDLLSFDIKSLYVTGIDAYESIPDLLDGKNEEYVPGYLPKFTFNQRKNRLGKPVSLHDKYRDTKVILEMEEGDPRFTIDPVCKKKMEKVVYGKN